VPARAGCDGLRRTRVPECAAMMLPWFAALSALGFVLVVTAARVVRGRLFARFVAVILGVHTLLSVALASAFSWILPLYAALQAIVYVHLLGLSRPRMRPLPYRLLVSIPASWFVAGTFLAMPWALLAAAGLHPWWPWLPYLVAAAGALDSLFTKEEVVEIALDGQRVDGLQRRAHGTQRAARPLRIVQITDPHLGPFMSVARLRRIALQAVAKQPDLILLTGDFLTMESQQDASHLSLALAPLRSLAGRAFACRGNHDLECPEIVASALQSAGVVLLVDQAVQVVTPAGPVEVLGIDYTFQNRAEHIAQLLAAHPRRPGELRVAMLHDPGAFKHLPDGAADLVLSGHTHGGQLGLLWFGLPSTIVSALTALPDHGFWASGSNRLYVHRGTGHYGFPLRIGVPAEDSVLLVHPVSSIAQT
jgi:predicted MPP superfamily phosphohydrolase